MFQKKNSRLGFLLQGRFLGEDPLENTLILRHKNKKTNTLASSFSIHLKGGLQRG